VATPTVTACIGSWGAWDEDSTVGAAQTRSHRMPGEYQHISEHESVVTASAPFLLLTTSEDGRVTPTGHSSYWNSRTHDPSVDIDPHGRLKASGTASWHWDGSQLLARTSDTGLVPLYYYSDGNRLAISPSLLQLRDRYASPALDWPAIAILLAMGSYIGNDTPFAEIKALPIRSTLAWQNSQLTVEERTFDIPHLDIGYEEAKARYLIEVREAVERILPADGFALGLSGGRDSRHILLELLRSGVEPGRLVTSDHYLITSDADTTAASALADRAGLPVSRISPGPDRLRSELAKNELTEFQALSHSWALELAHSFSNASLMYDGMNGGVLFGRSRSVHSLRNESGEAPQNIEDIARIAIDRWFDKPIERLRALFIENPFTTADLKEARHRIDRSIRRQSTAPNPAQAFHYFNRTSRAGAQFTYGLMQAHRVLCPFDDPEVVRFGLGLPRPISHRLDLQADAIRTGYPEYSNVPFYWELKNVAKHQHWDRATEGRSAEDWISAYPAEELPMLNPRFKEAFVSALRDLQAVTYLAQLISWNDAHGSPTT